MKNLFRYSQIRIKNTSNTFTRYLYNEINWTDRLIGITGARGTGKTTLILQYLKNNFENSDQAIYVTLDDFYFTKTRLFDFAEEFYINGGRYLFIDEVHKYPMWAMDIKNLYDIFNDLQIVFSGSSAIQLQKANADLSRRAAIYHLHELSFREYLQLTTKKDFQTYSLQEILQNNISISNDIINKTNSILPKFKEYLSTGVYPFFIDSKGQFYDRLLSTINIILEVDLVSIEKINYQTSYKLKRLISLIADSVPFKVNISELSRKSELSRDVLLNLLNILERAGLIINIKQAGAPTGRLTKPDKIYLNNTVLLNALSNNTQVNTGTIRETFFTNQLKQKHIIEVPQKGDFFIDNKYTFEVGGKNKTIKQIQGIKDAYVVADDIEYGYKSTIPLWLFGFLY